MDVEGMSIAQQDPQPNRPTPFPGLRQDEPPPDVHRERPREIPD